MPIVGRVWGEQQLSEARKQVAYMFKEVVLLFDSLDDELGGFVDRTVSLLYPTSPTIMDYSIWEKKQNAWLAQLDTLVWRKYNEMSKLGTVYPKESFISTWKAAERLTKQLWKGSYRVLKEPTTEALVTEQQVVVNVGSGKVSREFMKFIKSILMNVDENPLYAIKTLSKSHIAVLQREFMKGITEGKNLAAIRSTVVDRITKGMSDPAIRKAYQHNVMRILRTTHQRAANSAFSEFAQKNSWLYQEKERVADGRPCLACVALDGRRYPLDAPMDDHIMGMCSFSPVMLTPEEMGLKIPLGSRGIWRVMQRPYQLYGSKFYQLSAAEQAEIFPTRALFRLWQKEKFPIGNLVVKSKSGGWVPMSYKQAEVSLEKLGGISYPKAIAVKELLAGESVESFNTVIDPLDRATKNLFVFRDKLPTVDFVDLTKLSRRQIMYAEDFVRIYPSLEKAHWWDFNQRARALGIYVRKDIQGQFYYAIPASFPKVSKFKVFAAPKAEVKGQLTVLERRGLELERAREEAEKYTVTIWNDVFGKHFDDFKKAPHLEVRFQKRLKEIAKEINVNPKRLTMELDALWEQREYASYAMRWLHLTREAENIHYFYRDFAVKVADYKRLKTLVEAESVLYEGQISREAFFALKKSYKLSETGKLPGAVREAYKTVGRVLTEQELLAEKKLLVKRMLNRSTQGIRGNTVAVERLTEALYEYPLRILNLFDEAGLKFGKTPGRVSVYFPSRRQIKFTGRYWDRDLYHEAAHALDDMAAGAKGAGRKLTYSGWTGTKLSDISPFLREEIDDFGVAIRKAYESKLTEGYKKFKYDSYRSIHRGKFIMDYDGVVYTYGKVDRYAVEYFAQNVERFLAGGELRGTFFAWDEELFYFLCRLLAE